MTVYGFRMSVCTTLESDFVIEIFVVRVQVGRETVVRVSALPLVVSPSNSHWHCRYELVCCY
jgi:hypothetical protein